jgi:hypothetical protein
MVRPLDDQRACHDRFVQVHFVQSEATDEAEHSATLNLIRDELQIDDVLVPAPWCLGRVVMLIETAPELRLFFCAEQLAGILRIAISFVALVQVSPPTEAAERELRTALGLVGQGDWDLIVALARLYDKEIHTKLPPGKRSRPLYGLLGARRG